MVPTDDVTDWTMDRRHLRDHCPTKRVVSRIQVSRYLVLS